MPMSPGHGEGQKSQRQRGTWTYDVELIISLFPWVKTTVDTSSRHPGHPKLSPCSQVMICPNNTLYLRKACHVPAHADPFTH